MRSVKYVEIYVKHPNLQLKLTIHIEYYKE